MIQNKVLRAERPLFLIQKFTNLLDEFSYDTFRNISISHDDKYITLTFEQDELPKTDWLLTFVQESKYFSLKEFTKDKEEYSTLKPGDCMLVTFETNTTYNITLVVECNFLK